MVNTWGNCYEFYNQWLLFLLLKETVTKWQVMKWIIASEETCDFVYICGGIDTKYWLLEEIWPLIVVYSHEGDCYKMVATKGLWTMKELAMQVILRAELVTKCRLIE